MRTGVRFCRDSASTVGPLVVFQRELPALGGLDRVGGTEHPHVRHRAQRGEMLDRLVGGAVLAKPDRVVGHDVDDRRMRQRRDAHRGARVVGETQEGAAGRREAAMGEMPFIAAAMPISRMP